MAQAALAVEIDRRLDIENHARFEHVLRLRVQSGTGVGVDGNEADAVAGRVLELRSEAGRSRTPRAAESTSAALAPGRMAARAAARAANTASYMALRRSSGWPRLYVRVTSTQ